jgi:hypothetical protein
VNDRAARIYRILLHAYPERTRRASGEDMVQLFLDQLRDAGSPLDQAGVWLAAIADVATTAPRERAATHRAARLIEGPALVTRRPVLPDLMVSAIPPLVAAFVVVSRPAFLAPMFDERVAIAGVPFGIGVTAVAAALAAIGLLCARRPDALREADVQALLLAILLVPFPMMLFLGRPETALAYAVVVIAFVLLARFRAAMLALVLPFILWLVFGPALVVAIIRLGSSGVS